MSEELISSKKEIKLMFRLLGSEELIKGKTQQELADQLNLLNKSG